MRYLYLLFTISFYFYLCDVCICGQPFLKAAKNVPRIGRSKQQQQVPKNEAFEKFFLKASKSVPRIGRRGTPTMVKY